AYKIDLQKAYDTIEWPALMKVMELMGFPSKFRQWVFACVSSSRFSVMVNGGSYGYFKGKRGLRQGCPMSPYLFVLVMEVFNVLIMRKVAEGSFSLHPRCTKPLVTHLAFADDLLVFSKGDSASAKALLH